EATSYLHRGLKIALVAEATNERFMFEHPNGIVEYLERLLAAPNKRVIHPTLFTLERPSDPRMELALAWTEATDEQTRTYANGIPTPAGGTHEAGLKQGVTKAVRNYMSTHDLMPKGLTIAAEDVREGIVAIL